MGKQGTEKLQEYTSRIKNSRHQRNDLNCVRIAQSRETLRSKTDPSHNVETHLARTPPVSFTKNVY